MAVQSIPRLMCTHYGHYPLWALPPLVFKSYFEVSDWLIKGTLCHFSIHLYFLHDQKLDMSLFKCKLVMNFCSFSKISLPLCIAGGLWKSHPSILMYLIDNLKWMKVSWRLVAKFGFEKILYLDRGNWSG